MFALKEKKGSKFLQKILIEPDPDCCSIISITLVLSDSDFMLFKDRLGAQTFARTFSRPDCVLCVVEV